MAVAAFLDGRIRFPHIPWLIEEALTRLPNQALDSVEACVDVDARARALTTEWLQSEQLTGAIAR